MDIQGSHYLEKIMQNKYYKSLYDKINPILFDVSLRDGIQNAPIENFPTERKIEIFQTLFTYYNPQNMEIGSLTSPKILRSNNPYKHFNVKYKYKFRIC
jgi:hypothetical protein